MNQRLFLNKPIFSRWRHLRWILILLPLFLCASFTCDFEDESIYCDGFCTLYNESNDNIFFFKYGSNNMSEISNYDEHSGIPKDINDFKILQNNQCAKIKLEGLESYLKHIDENYTIKYLYFYKEEVLLNNSLHDIYENNMYDTIIAIRIKDLVENNYIITYRGTN